MRAWAWARSALPFSAAARPSAIFWRRSSIAFVRGGQMNFIVNQPRTKNTIIWKKRVAFKFTVVFLIYPFVPCGDSARHLIRPSTARRPPTNPWPATWRRPALSSAHEGVGEREQHGQTHADQEGRVDQTDQQEHLGLQGVHQFGLASGGFQVLATHHADADASTDGAQTDDQTASESNERNVGHNNSLVSKRCLVKKSRTRNQGKPREPARETPGRIFSGLRAPARYTPGSAS